MSAADLSFLLLPFFQSPVQFFFDCVVNSKQGTCLLLFLRLPHLALNHSSSSFGMGYSLATTQTMKVPQVDII